MIVYNKSFIFKIKKELNIKKINLRLKKKKKLNIKKKLKKKAVLVIKRTRWNTFICLYFKKKMFFSVSFFSFIKRNTKNPYKLFWFRLFKFISVRLQRFKILNYNLLIYGRLYGIYNKLINTKGIVNTLNHLLYYTGISHNGCKLKKKKRK